MQKYKRWAYQYYMLRLQYIKLYYEGSVNKVMMLKVKSQIINFSKNIFIHRDIVCYATGHYLKLINILNA